ncbi:hypothetical protein COO60DRAFT_347840 [Scenedesmus sp. NREL 46B-D3]|nr:hypothetical protein COO60DRAFT_347840 [Scenedesmus sp. NREL 46B-D3]
MTRGSLSSSACQGHIIVSSMLVAGGTAVAEPCFERVGIFTAWLQATLIRADQRGALSCQTHHHKQQPPPPCNGGLVSAACGACLACRFFA